jgi:Leucine-rich repeat (LRR) protein
MERKGKFSLNLFNSGITEKDLRMYLEDYPNTFDEIVCSCNELFNLPQLPNKLKCLYCGNNELTSLPELPNILNTISCEYNRLTWLPRLPKNLEYLRCYGNKIINFDRFIVYYSKSNACIIMIKQHNALIEFQTIVRNIIWRRNASLKERCRRTIIVNYHKIKVDDLDTSCIPQDLIDYLK